MDIRTDQYPEPAIHESSKSQAEGSWSEHRAVNHVTRSSTQNSWVTRRRKIGKVLLPAYASPPVQIALVAFISFLCPGMWNALNGLGGGGLVQAEPANNANVALYSTFSVAGFFAGIATNKLGVRATLSLGGLGYSLYSSSLLCYKHTQNSGFLLFAGLQLGLCAGLFWAAQGMVMISYPTEESKGKYISWSWMIYNMGAVIGSIVSHLRL
jgi:MFS family permease